MRRAQVDLLDEGRAGQALHAQDVVEHASMPASSPACCSSRAASCAAAAPASRCADAAFAFAFCSSYRERKTSCKGLMRPSQLLSLREISITLHTET